MYQKAVNYKDNWLAPGSVALELYQAKKWKELDEHLAKLHKDYLKLAGLLK